ncbi:GNAT family N-acetyltransferase [Nostoc sp. FACHB-152]|uniref:GNAT family N-acetyltransferase n=1 Tax=unclassified Nostoc TaxID=2593658 RepID=UPI001689BE6B|nr:MULTISPECIES: GNAT family N-acetyltransferase [unclassified Nostoc]MBD2445597.1 GNAT family N-acetyltransferase [Nostoc sp. FACHB-152]MBD2466709.1 GNAT family N-acetyltransferase [Nostoc sp. FACHB-145]
MYQLNLLNNSTANEYEWMTFPSYQYLLHKLDTDDRIVAIGATKNQQPIGLVLAQIVQDRIAIIFSIFVAMENRGKGVGTALLSRVETELQSRGCKIIQLSYTTGKPTTRALEHLLEKRNWTPPQTRTLVCRGEADKVMEANWLKRYSRLPSSYSIFPWQEITPQERQAILQQQQTQPWIPEDLVPFNYEDNLEPLNSLGLRYEGQVVGWVINHRIAPDTIRYTCSFVREDLQKMGRIISLYAEACERQLKANIPHGIWTVPSFHKSMVAFVRNRWSPYLNSIDESRGTLKLI